MRFRFLTLDIRGSEWAFLIGFCILSVVVTGFTWVLTTLSLLLTGISVTKRFQCTSVLEGFAIAVFMQYLASSFLVWSTAFTTGGHVTSSLSIFVQLLPGALSILALRKSARDSLVSHTQCEKSKLTWSYICLAPVIVFTIIKSRGHEFLLSYFMGGDARNHVVFHAMGISRGGTRYVLETFYPLLSSGHISLLSTVPRAFRGSQRSLEIHLHAYIYSWIVILTAILAISIVLLQQACSDSKNHKNSSLELWSLSVALLFSPMLWISLRDGFIGLAIQSLFILLFYRVSQRLAVAQSTFNIALLLFITVLTTANYPILFPPLLLVTTIVLVGLRGRTRHISRAIHIMFVLILGASTFMATERLAPQSVDYLRATGFVEQLSLHKIVVFLCFLLVGPVVFCAKARDERYPNVRAVTYVMWMYMLLLVAIAGIKSYYVMKTLWLLILVHYPFYLSTIGGVITISSQSRSYSNRSLVARAINSFVTQLTFVTLAVFPIYYRDLNSQFLVGIYGSNQPSATTVSELWTSIRKEEEFLVWSYYKGGASDDFPPFMEDRISNFWSPITWKVRDGFDGPRWGYSISGVSTAQLCAPLLEFPNVRIITRNPHLAGELEEVCSWTGLIEVRN